MNDLTDRDDDCNDDDYEAPCGSCEICGTNLYPDDDFLATGMCDQCAFLTMIPWGL